jgi:omega-amidase
MQNLTITTVQADLEWEQKEQNLHLFDILLDTIQQPTDVVILPEMFTTGFSMNASSLAEPMYGNTFQWMLAKARKLQAALVGSIIVRHENTYRNRLLWVQPDETIHYYDKRHLFALSAEHQHYTPGKLPPPRIHWRGWNILPLICYDLRFPVWSRNTPQNPYDLLIYVANWPQRRSLAWKSLTAARAIENQSFVAAVNRIGNDNDNLYHSGDTILYNPLGEIIHTAAHIPDVHTITLQYNTLHDIRLKFPFLRDADTFTIHP